MARTFQAGEIVQTPFGQGTIREVRNNARVLVDVRGRAMVFPERDLAPVDDRKRRPAVRDRSRHDVPQETSASRDSVHLASEIDLHGLTVDEALARAEAALNDALMADVPEVRFIHGRTGGRIRGALHRWLGGIASVRTFRIDPRNPGVTIVVL